MSYSMSAPQKAAPRPYSPYQNAASPTNPSQFGPPSAKRQRMSPDPRSPPNGVPNYAHPQHGLPNSSPGPYGNPYAPSSAQSPYGPPTYANSPQSSFNTPQAYPYQQMPWHAQPSTPQQRPDQYGARPSPPSQHSREMMPPPPRPNKEEREEKVGVEEIGDSLFGSGINLKDEENYMHTMYNNRHAQSDSFTSNQNTSFGSSTMSANNSFNMLTQGTSFGSQSGANGAFAGTLGQPRSQEAIEVEQRRKREAAARSQAERRQHHLNNQFLLCNNVRKRVDRLALNQGVTVSMQGVFVRQTDTNVMTSGSGGEGIVAAQDRVNGVKSDVRPESVVNQNTPFEHVASLISLAAGERLRGLMDEAFALARIRKYGDHGRVVPADFADIAVGEGQRREEDVVPESLTGSQWDKVPEQHGHEALANGEKEKSSTPQPQSTVSFQGTLNAHLRELTQRNKQAEQERIKKRETRRKAAEATANGDTTPADASALDAPIMNGAEALAPTKVSKKEQDRQRKAANQTTEASTTNQTAAMMALGKKGSRYSWMTGGAAAMPTNRFAKPGGTGASGTATPAANSKMEAGGSNGGGSAPTTPGAVTAVKAVEAPQKIVEWGDWSEEKAKRVEMRDWVLVLERDGKEKGALQRAMNMMVGA